jgi:hypothetical protein
MEELSNYISNKIDYGIMADFRKLYMPRSAIEAFQMKHESKIKKLNSETLFLNSERKKLEEKWETLPTLFIDKEIYETDMQTFALKKEIQAINTYLGSLAKETDMIK